MLDKSTLKFRQTLVQVRHAITYCLPQRLQKLRQQQVTSRRHWIQRITFTAKTMQSILKG